MQVFSYKYIILLVNISILYYAIHMKIEMEIKSYLKNRNRIKEDLSSRLLALKEDIQNSKAGCPFDVADFSLSTSSIVKPGKEGTHREISDAIVKYENCLESFMKRYAASIDNKTNLINTLSDQMDFYDKVDLMIYSLEEREYRAINDLIKGKKISDTAKHLGCSYNTARAVLSKAIRTIASGIDMNIQDN